MNTQQRKPQGPIRGKPVSPRSTVLWLLAALAFLFFLIILGNQRFATQQRRVQEPELYEWIKQGKVESITFAMGDRGVNDVFVKMCPGTVQDLLSFHITTNSQGVDDIKKLALENNVSFDFKRPNRFFDVMMWPILLLILIGAFYFLFMRQLRAAGGGNVLTFGKSRARRVGKERPKVTFNDVAGIEEAKEEVKELIEFLKNPAKFQRLGGRIPRGVLLIGPPGTGKTLLAKAIAGEAEVPFFSISGSDFVEMFVGVGASRVRDLFREAKENSPCIVFLDEIDAVGRRRGHGWGGGHDEREQTLNAILVEMDGFESDAGVIVIAATNRPDVLDHALLRPGRFDRTITVDLPDLKGREEILRVHARKVKLAKDADLSILARGTPMFSGADLEAIINEAALLAALKGKEAIHMEDLEEARDKVRWGRQKQSRVMAEEDKKITAIHEAGHALLSKILPDAEPLHKVTIIPRGAALGATMQLPERDRYHLQKKNILSQIKVLYAGRVAEEIFHGDISAGARNDISQATELARLMVREWGMSDRVGPVSYADSEDKLYGGEVVIAKSYSEKTAIEIDEEIKRILKECFEEVKHILSEHREEVHRIAEALLKYEILTAAEIDLIIEGKDPKAAKAPPPGAEQKPSEEEKKATEQEGLRRFGVPKPRTQEA